MRTDSTQSRSRKKALQDAAWRPADEWHDRKRSNVTVDDLEVICPGYTKVEYTQAINDALLWVSK